MGQSDESVTSYDNFEVMEGVKEQRVDHQGTFHSVTTGQVIQGIEIPSGGLRQDMLDSRAEICASDVFLAPGNRDDDINRQISRYFSYEAINTIFSNAIPDAARKQRPAMPVVDVLEPVKTVHCSLGPIPHDESSNAGNILILENIFQHQYHLPDSAFEQRLFLIYGDQKTTQRIRSIKQRREEAQRPCDRLQWALPVPALFHLRMNYLYMISRLHFGGPGSDQSTLYDAMNFWTRKRISKSSADFYALEQLIIHSFQARVCALLWNMLAQSGQGIGLEFEDIARMLAIHDAGTFSQLLDRIVDSYGKYARSTDDEELRNHILFLQHTQTYLLLKYSIKHADLGLLRRAIDRCCVYFHGSGQSRYAFEMLYLQRLTSTRAATPELQRAILANGLVNRQGKADSWYETDRLVEFHNGTLRKLLNAKRGSSLTLDYLFEHCALNTDFFATLAKQTESFYGIHRSSKHPEKSAERDIRVMAQRLSHSRSIALHSGRTVKHKATDVLAAGAMCIAGKAIAKFNRMACSVDYDYLEGDEDELDDGQEDEDEIDEELGHFFAVDHADEE
ncbi:hypothetical protein EDB80DRAFT_693140 [Ilyonectria destructans]|nr:hypothetical protein EDB80DRAFT_693140 [Ilyonectria destructans]